MNLPQTLKTLQQEDLIKVNWKDIRDGMIVYLYTQHEGREWGLGPFQVVKAKTRELKRPDSVRSFLHYPEELYRLKVKGA